ncbi:hypothetical protein M2281_005123 [Mesorhizobium soli]|nr:hypothetical protein [Mesorhizobium soli]
MTGHENSPDYGGGKLYAWQTAAAAVMIALAVAGMWWFYG